MSRTPVPSRRSRHGKGRTATGVGAAAVTTVLAAVISGQVATGEHRSEERVAGVGMVQRDGDDDPASRSGGDGREEEKEPEPSQKPPTYAEKLAEPEKMTRDFAGPGTFRTMSGKDKGAEAGQKLRYRIDVERKLGMDGELFTEAVHRTLNDERSWAHGGELSFERVSSGQVDFVLTLASPGTTDVWCAKSGLDTSEQTVSCDSAATERVMINGYRWAHGSKTFGDDRLDMYRQMLINHEVGHRIGYGHVGCEKDGALAPVMMQQTKTLETAGRTCEPNAWPHPDA